MGPINQKWILDNGTGWSAGRVDIRGDTMSPWGDEFSIPPVKTEDWNSFSDWMDDFESEEQLNLKGLLKEYGKPMRWLDPKDELL